MPVTVYDGTDNDATYMEPQRKVFHNPRGTGYFYSLFRQSSSIYIYKSSDGSSWSNAYSGTVATGVQPSLWIYEDVSNSKLIIHLTYRLSGVYEIQYRRLEIADAGSDISAVGAEQEIDSADEGNYRPMIFLGRQGYLHIVYCKDVKDKGKNFYHVYIRSTTSTYPLGASPTWDTAEALFTATQQDILSYPTGSPCFGSTYEGVVAFYHGYTAWYHCGKNFQYDGSDYTFGTLRTLAYVQTPPKHSLVVDASGTHGIGHWLFVGGNGTLNIVKWTIGTGFGTPLQIGGGAPPTKLSCALGIDKTAATDRIIAFYVKNGVAGDLFYKTAEVDWSVIGDWSSEEKIDDDSEACAALSCSYEDWNGDSKIQLIYTTQTTQLVRYVEVTLAVAPVLKEVTDTIGLADVAFLPAKTVISPNTVSLVDVVKLPVRTIVSANTISLADVIRAHKILVIADTISLADALLITKLLTVADAISLADAIKLPVKNVITPDTIGLADVVKLPLRTLITPETIDLSDVVKLPVRTLITPDTIGLADAARVNKNLFILDTVGLSDTITIFKLLTILDTIGLSDVVKLDKTLVVTDTIAAVDVALVDKLLIMPDNLSLADVVSLPSKAVIILEAVTLADTPRVHKVLTIPDTVDLIDAVLVNKILVMSDTVSLSDFIEVIVLGILKQVTDTITLTDLALRTNWPVLLKVSGFRRGIRPVGLRREIDVEAKRRGIRVDPKRRGIRAVGLRRKIRVERVDWERDP